jgi:hypothetical protein
VIGEAKTGISLEYAWNIKSPKPKEQIESLKAGLPKFLKDEQFTNRSPGIKRMDVSKWKEIKVGDKASSEALIRFGKNRPNFDLPKDSL